MRRAALAASLLLATAAAPAPAGAQAPPAPLAAPEAATPFDTILVDRIVAVVDEDPILLSEVEEVIGLGLAARRSGESDDELRERVVDGLIEQRLRFHEVDRSGFQRVPVAEIEERLAELVAAFDGPEAFRRRLAELGMTEPEVRQLVARQLAVLTYVEERLGARVFVGLEDIRAYYQETVVPDHRARGREPPPLDEVREAIRAVLSEERLNQEIARWTDELRREADVVVFPSPPASLPPVVDTIP